MKTLTEIDGFRLKAALEKKTELTKAGKTAEELPAALGEALKLEGDKLAVLLAALELAETISGNLKRIVVYAVEEGKAGPSGAVQKGEKWFLSEFFYVPQAQPRGGRDGDGKRGGGRGGRGGGKKGGRGGPGGGGRGDRDRGGRSAPGGRGAPGAPGGGGERSASGKEGGGGGRPPRGERPPRRPDGPPPKLPVPNKVPAPAKAAETPSKPQSESESSEGSSQGSSGTQSS